MHPQQAFTRRGFVGGLATAIGYLSIESKDAWARGPYDAAIRAQQGQDYDSMAKLHFNENPWGPSESVMEAMAGAWRYSNRYGYPDGDIVEAIAKHHGVETSHIVLGAGSGEILDVVGTTFLDGGKKVVGCNPSYGSVYTHATRIRSEAHLVPLLADYRQDIPALIEATRRNHRDVGFVYLCNPNNPTGRTVTAAEVRQLLDGIPEDVPVLVDEAYHHYVEDPAYATSVPYVLEGRNVIVARTFSKVYGMAGMRLGYAVAPPDLIQRMRPWSTGSINALVKWGGVAALRDDAAMSRVRTETLHLRKKTIATLESMGFDVIPTETNFFMLHVRRPSDDVREQFRRHGVLVGRSFPPLTEHLRVSVGTPAEIDRFMVAFRQSFGISTDSGDSTRVA
jgi:histidinol-phosphate aminotransferase